MENSEQIEDPIGYYLKHLSMYYDCESSLLSELYILKTDINGDGNNDFLISDNLCPGSYDGANNWEIFIGNKDKYRLFPTGEIISKDNIYIGSLKSIKGTTLFAKSFDDNGEHLVSYKEDLETYGLLRKDVVYTFPNKYGNEHIYNSQEAKSYQDFCDSNKAVIKTIKVGPYRVTRLEDGLKVEPVASELAQTEGMTTEQEDKPIIAAEDANNPSPTPTPTDPIISNTGSPDISTAKNTNPNLQQEKETFVPQTTVPSPPKGIDEPDINPTNSYQHFLFTLAGVLFVGILLSVLFLFYHIRHRNKP